MRGENESLYLWGLHISIDLAGGELSTEKGESLRRKQLEEPAFSPSGSQKEIFLEKNEEEGGVRKEKSIVGRGACNIRFSYSMGHFFSMTKGLRWKEGALEKNSEKGSLWAFSSSALRELQHC